MERKPKKKGYMRLHTNLGDLNLEMHCDITPRACENFMILADSGYYTGTVFHRSIKNFMIQVLLPPLGSCAVLAGRGYNSILRCRRSCYPGCSEERLHAGTYMLPVDRIAAHSQSRGRHMLVCGGDLDLTSSRCAS